MKCDYVPRVPDVTSFDRSFKAGTLQVHDRRQSFAALPVEGRKAGPGEVLLQRWESRVDQAEFDVEWVVEERPSLFHPRPKAGDRATGGRSRLTGPGGGCLLL